MQPELAYLGQEAAGRTIALATRFQRDGQEIIECRATDGTLLQTVTGPLTPGVPSDHEPPRLQTPAPTTTKNPPAD